MKTNYLIKLAINGLTHSKIRTWLTIIGIVIGIASVVAILSIGAGMEYEVTQRMSGLGADLITITPGYTRAMEMMGMGGGGPSGSGKSTTTNLTNKDIMALKLIPNILYISGSISGQGELSYMSQTVDVNIQGIDSLNWKYITTSELESGRMIDQGDSNVAVIGSKLASDMFENEITINRQIMIEGVSFRVVGILSEGSGVYVPIEAARSIIDDVQYNQYHTITVKVTDATLIEDVTIEITERLSLSRHASENEQDFTVSSSQAMQETVSSMVETMSIFLGGIAAISLLVGAIGIANTMLMSVIERTKQIGILKALGARNEEILKLFLFESGIFGLIGGILGVILGSVISLLISQIGIRMMGSGGSMTTLITPQLLIYALSFSVILGMVSGFFPARSAAKLQPVDALRYE